MIRRIYRVISMIITAIGLSILYYSVITNPQGGSILYNTIRYFTFFTVISNILVCLWFARNSVVERDKPFCKGALILYIGITAIVYFLILKEIWDPTGIVGLGNTIAHGIVPMLLVLDWFIFDKKGQFRYGDIWEWLHFPLAYLFFMLIVCHFLGRYPYPFIDLTTLSWTDFLRNIGVIMIGFMILACFIVTIDKLFAAFSKRKGEKKDD